MISLCCNQINRYIKNPADPAKLKSKAFMSEHF